MPDAGLTCSAASGVTMGAVRGVPRRKLNRDDVLA